MRRVYVWSVNKQELARLLARLSHRSCAQAADYVDTLVHRLIKGSKNPPAKPSEERSAAAGASTPRLNREAPFRGQGTTASG